MNQTAEHSARRNWWLLTCAILLALVAAVSLWRGLNFEFDFHHFYRDAEYVWHHGALNPVIDEGPFEDRRQLPFYLPTVSILLAPLAALGPRGAAVVWAVMQVAALGTVLAILLGWVRRAGRLDVTAEQVMVIVGLLALPVVYEAARFNQLSFLILALVLAGAEAVVRGRSWRGGALLGLAATIKLLPGVFLIWLVLKRRWTATLAFLLLGIVIVLAPCLAVFGPARTWEYHKQWWQHNIAGAAGRGMVAPELREHFIDHRNQSITAVAARTLDPQHPYRTPWQPLELGAARAGLAARWGLGLIALALIAATRRPLRDLSGRRARLEAALYALAMLLCSPLLRQYYLVWALPALALLAAAAADRNLGSLRRRLGWLAIALWLVGMLAWLSPTARLYGAHLAMLIALALLLGSLRHRAGLPTRARRRP